MFAHDIFIISSWLFIVPFSRKDRAHLSNVLLVYSLRDLADWAEMSKGQQPQTSTTQQDPQFKLDGTPYDVEQMIG